MMKPRDLAALLQGGELGDFPSEARTEASRAGLVMVYSPSADEVTFSGALDGIADMLGGGVIYFDLDGVLPEVDEVPEHERAFYYARKRFAHQVDVHWDQNGFKWSFTTPLPHARFVVMNNGERYCRGIIFDIRAIGGREAA